MQATTDESVAAGSGSDRKQPLGSKEGQSASQSSAAAAASAGGDSLRFLVTHKLLLVRVLPARAADLVVDLVHAAAMLPLSAVGASAADAKSGSRGGSAEAPAHAALLDQTLTALAEVWSQPSFVRHAPPPQQRYVTHALLAALRCAGEDQQRRQLSSGDEGLQQQFAFSAHASLPSLMEGVQQRLSNPVPAVRAHGMRVAEAFSRVLDPAQPLQFDAPADEEEQRELAEAERERARRAKERQQQQQQQAASSSAEAKSDGKGDEKEKQKQEGEAAAAAGDDDLKPFSLHDDEKVFVPWHASLCAHVYSCRLLGFAQSEAAALPARLSRLSAQGGHFDCAGLWDWLWLEPAHCTCAARG